MIDLYTSPTPNGYKVSIALEEMELPYETIPSIFGRESKSKRVFEALAQWPNPGNLRSRP